MLNHSIRTLHTNKSGKVSDKWSSYLDYYDALFYPLRECDISMLEVGVQNGGSLETWAQYFVSGKHFVGCDIDPNCSALRFDDPRIQVIIGDVNQQNTYNQIVSIDPSYSLIIDDGSHKSTDVLRTFINYFPLLKPGGYFIIEDSHCLYSSAFGGGILNEYSAQHFFKKLTDLVSYQWWEKNVSLETFFQGFFTNGPVPSFMLEGWVDSISFRNSLITISKAKQPGHGKLGDRIVAGSKALVQNWGGTPPA
jgi:hypothetical protein